ncbi:GNAT family N-acetyltransferase [Phenylobacterium aquaticum]|uniref:GNAT family N-acetyltransferase n=1 Tax=Phenylobacterium aquaticum TaxID=1763816 RepID=UPI001F5CB5D4|nr:GNAT family N-acetyltransferase [Phenylobacterium aquaticum]MCI3132312.1 GNAT family N-acetyltransferase [Phenylobacterium aquaticum]
MTITIRPCGPADAAALALVGQATFLQSYADSLPAGDIALHCAHEHGEARYAAWLADPAYRIWGAEVAPGGALVGYAVMSPPDLPGADQPGDVELKRLYLLHRFHGGGTGAALMRAVVEAARAGGFRRLLLGVYGENQLAMDFYARQGFARAGVRKFQVGAQVYDDLVLARRLDEDAPPTR